MTKYVRDTAAGKSISAYVILRHGKEVATVLSHYGNGGSVLVNVFQLDAAAKRCAAARNKINKVDKEKRPDHGNDPSDFTFQHARAGGGGYDKFTAALSGMWIDGHQLNDHRIEGLKYLEAIGYQVIQAI